MPQPSPPTVMRTYGSSIATFSRPFARFGVLPIGGRTTAVALKDGGAFVIASTPLDEVTKDKIQNDFGGARFIVCNDVVHHLFAGDYAKAWPDAKVIGVEGLPEKRPDLKWSGVYGKDPEGTKYGFEDEFHVRYFPTFGNRDVVFVHKDSKTLIQADLLFNLPPKEQYSTTKEGRPTSWLPFSGLLSKQFQPNTGFHRQFLWMAGADGPVPGIAGGGSPQEKRSQFAKDAAAVAGWEFERIIPAHGEVIEGTKGEAKRAWISAFGKYLNDDGTAKV